MALRLFLELTETQVAAIQQANADFDRLAAQRQRRMAQVQQEIADEMAKDPVDPLALGLRYAEMVSIWRFLEGEQGRLRDKVRQVLTEPQRARLRALEEALKLLPLYYEATGVNLLAPLRGFGLAPGVARPQSEPISPEGP